MVCTQGHHTHTAGPNDRRGVLGVLGPDAVQQRTREGSTGLKRLQLRAAQRYFGVLGPDAVQQKNARGVYGAQASAARSCSKVPRRTRPQRRPAKDERRVYGAEASAARRCSKLAERHMGSTGWKRLQLGAAQIWQSGSRGLRGCKRCREHVCRRTVND